MGGSMVLWLKAELACLFAWIQWDTLHTAQTGQITRSELMMPAAIGTVWGTVVWYFVALRKAAKSSA